MAKKEASKTLSELESEEISLETTIPTDATLSPPSDEARGRSRITKQMLEKKQLMHEIQVLKVELSQKNLIIDNLKTEYSTRVEELEDRLSETNRQKQILRVKLESELTIQKEESLRKQGQIRTELENILKKQRHLEDTNAKLQELSGDIRNTLKNLEISESRYFELKNLEEEQLSLRDLIAVKIFDAIRLFKFEVEHLQKTIKILEEELNISRSQLLNCEEQLKLEKKEHAEVQTNCQKVIVELSELKGNLQQGDYKIENYDKIKSERNHFEQEFFEFSKKCQHFEIFTKTLTQERDDLKSELLTLKQKVNLLQHDKDYFSKKISDFTNRNTYVEEKLQQAQLQLENSKSAREEMYEKYISAR